jgi:hypothetical protein
VRGWNYSIKLSLICCFCLPDSHELGGGSTERYPGSKSHGHPDYGKSRGSGSDPVFDNNLITNVTAQLGGTAFLHCCVRNLGERPVSRGQKITSLLPDLRFFSKPLFQFIRCIMLEDNIKVSVIKKIENNSGNCRPAQN